MKIAVLIENEGIDGRDDLQPEFGLSLHVELGGVRLLFDTGASAAFAANAAALGIDLARVDVAVLSHQHYDHGGGLARFFELNRRATVHLRDSPLRDRYSDRGTKPGRPIGIDLELVRGNPLRFARVIGTVEVAPGIFLLTDIGAQHPRPEANRLLLVEQDGALAPDTFDHELVMVAQESDGIVVFTGCSHSGVLNMLDSAAARFPSVPIKAVVGGFHLMGRPPGDSMAGSRAEVEALGRQIRARVSGVVLTGHCTGRQAFDVLHGVMGQALQRLSTGVEVEV